MMLTQALTKSESARRSREKGEEGAGLACPCKRLLQNYFANVKIICIIFKNHARNFASCKMQCHNFWELRKFWHLHFWPNAKFLSSRLSRNTSRTSQTVTIVSGKSCIKNRQHFAFRARGHNGFCTILCKISSENAEEKFWHRQNNSANKSLARTRYWEVVTWFIKMTLFCQNQASVLKSFEDRWEIQNSLVEGGRNSSAL